MRLESAENPILKSSGVILNTEGLERKTADGDNDIELADEEAVPSVTLKVETPDCVEDSFFKGQIHVTVKDKVFEPSHAFRNAVESDDTKQQAVMKVVNIT